MEKHTESNVVEMDTVHGNNKTGNVMLTLLFRNCNFMLIKLTPECRQECMKNVFDELTEQLGRERLQELFPVILPKGNSFADYIQDDMTLLMNHINSTARASLNGRTPYELARLLLKQELYEVMGAKEVAADKILLTPALLKR